MLGEPTALESTGDGMSLLVGAADGGAGHLSWIGRADGARVLDARLPGPVRPVRRRSAPVERRRREAAAATASAAASAAQGG